MQKYLLYIIVPVCLIALLSTPSVAATLETEVGPIIYQSDKDLIEYGRKIRSIFSPTAFVPSKATIAARHEFIFAAVCKELDIVLNDAKTFTRIVKTKAELQKVYDAIPPGTGHKVNAFYHHPEKTIWLALESLTPAIAAHEIGHAVMDHYFIRQVPAGIDEMVAEDLEELLDFFPENTLQPQ